MIPSQGCCNRDLSDAYMCGRGGRLPDFWSDVGHVVIQACKVVIRPVTVHPRMPARRQRLARLVDRALRRAVMLAAWVAPRVAADGMQTAGGIGVTTTAVGFGCHEPIIPVTVRDITPQYVLAGSVIVNTIHTLI